jgi:hypothetical protein
MPTHAKTRQLRILREDQNRVFPRETFFFEPAGITNQTLNRNVS